MADLTIVIVDDHPIIRDGLSHMLAEVGRVNVLAACGSCSEAITVVERHRPRILLLDAELPDRDGINAIPDFLAISPETRVVVFTAAIDDKRAEAAMRLGAKAVLLKSTPATELISALATIAAEEGASITQPDGVGASDGVGEPDRRHLTALTVREREIAERVARGERNKQIAWDLGIAEGTVKLHLSRAFRKLGVDNRVALSRALGLTRDLRP